MAEPFPLARDVVYLQKSLDNEFIKVVIGVNGGFNHAYERQKYLFDLIDRLKVRNCSVHGGRLYERYKFSESSLSQSGSGSAIWKNYFGIGDEIFKR